MHRYCVEDFQPRALDARRRCCRKKNRMRMGTGWLVGLLVLGCGTCTIHLGDACGEELQSAGGDRPELRLTLKDAMDAAMDNSPNVKLFKERIAAARAVVSTQLGAMLPNLSSNVRQTRQILFLGTLGLVPQVTNPFSIFDARANLTQNLFSMSLIDRWRASRSALQVAELESDATRFDTMAEVALAYMEVLRAEAALKARETNVKLFSELTALARSRRGGGMGGGLDAARAQAQLENERHQVVILRNEVQRHRLNLLYVLGITDEVTLILLDELKSDAVAIPSAQEALMSALRDRMEVKAQQQRIRTAELALHSTVMERLPSLSAQGDYGLIGNRMHNTADTYNVGVFLSVPLFDGG